MAQKVAYILPCLHHRLVVEVRARDRIRHQPVGIGRVERIVVDIGVEIDAAAVPDRVRLQEAAEQRRVVAAALRSHRTW